VRYQKLKDPESYFRVRTVWPRIIYIRRVKSRKRRKGRA